jgi:hypothetical protein
MPAKPNPGLGLVLGLVLGYLDIAVASYAANRLAVARQVTFDTALGHGLQWLVLLVAIALVNGLVMAPRKIGAGVMVGAGLLMSLSGLAVQLLPLARAVDVSTVFELFGDKYLPYLLLDGSVLFMGLIFLVAGIGRWVADAKLSRPTDPAQLQGFQGQPPMFPANQPQQWSYPGQQQQPGQQPPYPGQQQQPGRQPPYPGQQQQPGQQPPYPGQQPRQ